MVKCFESQGGAVSGTRQDLCTSSASTVFICFFSFSTYTTKWDEILAIMLQLQPHSTANLERGLGCSPPPPGVSKARIVSPQDCFHRRCNAPGKGAYAHRHSNNFLSKTGRPLHPAHSIPCRNHLLILRIIIIIVTIIVHKTSLHSSN